MRRWWSPLLTCLALAGCLAMDPYAALPIAQYLPRDDPVGDCARLFRHSDALIEAADTRDVQTPRVSGFPYLRVDRTLAALAPQTAVEPHQAAAWRDALAALDESSRRLELRNAGHEDAATGQALDDCRRRLATADLQQLPVLRDAAQVPDDYSLTARVLGLYPLTRYVFAAGIRRWQHGTLADFVAHSDADPWADRRRRRYVAGPSPATLPTPGSAPELGLPDVAPADLAALLTRHAPVLAIETASDDDRPGALVWRPEAGRLRIDVAVDRPVLYVRRGYTRIGERWLLQLSYTTWFAARPSMSPIDLLAGRLDGLLWRVTLAEDGSALVYDTIHPCGCYHLFLPTERLSVRRQPETLDEGLFVPQTMRSPAADERIVLKVAAGSHYLQRVDIETAPGNESLALELRDDDELRSLPLPGGGRRSAFGADGLIAGSERLERYFFWPMGIASAGQMRQWGRHATAFVGRRHFDDPLLFDRYFQLPP
ncbi:hypothetical protein [Accumulibacter sp.]|uniref:hypothetical protein n=1 Tax=Accumulibacter sp. TaxID=2053492 RepID=UPI0026033397|nr:hypothetical protein [Accumulibacter sp.]